MTRLFPKLYPTLSSAIAAASLLGALIANAFAVEPTDQTLADITNFRQYSATFAS